jgi:hypothetical protein
MAVIPAKAVDSIVIALLTRKPVTLWKAAKLQGSVPLPECYGLSTEWLNLAPGVDHKLRALKSPDSAGLEVRLVRAPVAWGNLALSGWVGKTFTASENPIGHK